MSKSQVVTTCISEELSGQLDALAEALERSGVWIVAKAIERPVREEADFLAFVQEAIDAADRGELIGQDENEARLASRHLQAAAE